MITANEVRQTMVPSIKLILNTIELVIMSAKNLGHTMTKYEVPPLAVPHLDAIVKELNGAGFRTSSELVKTSHEDYFVITIGW